MNVKGEGSVSEQKKLLSMLLQINCSAIRGAETALIRTENLVITENDRTSKHRLTLMKLPQHCR